MNQTPPPDSFRDRLVLALKEIKRLRDKVSQAQYDAKEPLAIIGIGLNLPGGARDLPSLWRLLQGQVDAVGPVPANRWDMTRFYDPDPEAPGKTYATEAGFLPNIDQFDPSFFKISPREANNIDPQQRLLLEVAWEAFENAGIVPATLVDSDTGVFVGIGVADYGSLMHQSSSSDGYAIVGSHPSFSAGRIAFHLGLQGPAVSLDTACSSSLVALHLACGSLRTRECSLAVVGGTAAMASPRTFTLLARTRALSPSGRSKTFSSNADGYGRGEGAVALVLERLSDAQRHGHEILALIRGSAVTHDGSSSGITAPNGASQRRVLRAALADAGLAPAEINYVECHGTGTSLGDPIEVHAVGEVYAEGRPKDAPLLLGTIKTNIGHLEAASGLAGVAKVVAALRHGMLPASLHSNPRNPHIDWKSIPVDVVDKNRSWPGAGPHRAGVSAFGLSGTNAHTLLESAPPVAAAEAADAKPGTASMLPFLLSGRSEAALRAQATRLREHVETEKDQRLVDVAYSLATSRSHFEYRALIGASDSATLVAKLAELAGQGTQSRSTTGQVKGKPKVALLFTGQGSQRLGMGRELYETFSAYRDAFDEVCGIFDRFLQTSLRDVVFGDAASGDALIDQTAYAQPALFALEVSLFRLYQSWGVEPDVMFGHSVGELVAATIAGVFTLEDACRLVAARGRLMQALPQGGAMVSIQASEQEVQSVLADHMGVDIAGLNGPMSTVVSGDEQPTLALAAHFEGRGRQAKRLNVSHAFHSRRMVPMLEEFRAVAESITYAAPRIRIISDVTGRLATSDELCTPDYWVRHVRAAVRFLDAVHVLEGLSARVLLEIGPHGVLTSMAAECLSEAGQAATTLVPSLRRGVPEADSILGVLASLHCHGVGLDWRTIFLPHACTRVPLPTYAFQRSRCWLDITKSAATVGEQPSAGRYPLSGQRIELPNGVILHTVPIGPAIQSYLGDHGVYDTLVVPGAFYLAVLLAVGESSWPGKPIELRDVEFIRAVSFRGPDDELMLHVQLAPVDGEPDQYTVTVLTRRSEDEWLTHANAVMAVDSGPAPTGNFDAASYSWLDDTEHFDDRLREMHIDWGPRWWWLQEHAALDGATILGRFEAPDEVPADDAPIPAGLIDGSFALLFWADGYIVGGTPQLPFAAQRMRWLGRSGTPTHARFAVREATGSSSKGDIVYYDSDGQLLAVIEGFATRLAPAERLLPSQARQDLYVVDWVAVPTDDSPLEIAVIGEDRLGLTSQRDFAVRLPDFASIRTTPSRVAVVTGGGDSPLAATLAMVGALRQWLEFDALAEHRLVVVTQMAVDVRSGPGQIDLAAAPISLAAAPIWGLVRSLMAEYPDRDIRLVDVDTADAAAGLRRALGSSEPQLAVRGAALLAPRLARATAISEPLAAIDPEATVLITGATGGLGTMLAKHIVARHGVRHLLLLSRQGPAAVGATQLLAALEAAGAAVQLLACDVTNRGELAAALETVSGEHPLGAVFHTAGVLHDATFEHADQADFARVFAPKVEGSRHLHELTLPSPLSHFVLFSSLAGVLGSAGQTSYAAANTYVDALCAERHRQGLPATSLAWGPWAEGGMAARLSAADRARLERQGMTPLNFTQGLALLDAALTQPAALQVPVQFDAVSLAKDHRLSPLLRGLVGARPRRRERSSNSGLTQRLSSLTEVEQLRELEQLFGQEAATILGWTDGSTPEREQPLQEFGLDSLMAVEFRNRLQILTGLRLESTLLFDYPSIAALAKLLCERISGERQSVASPTVAATARAIDETEAIAIVSMACRYPGGIDSPEQLWQLLVDGRDVITEFPVDRGWPDDLYDPDPQAAGKSVTRRGGFLLSAAEFDPAVFGISPREAVAIDPQQRLLLETSWEALERAGIAISSLRGTPTGVFVGVMYNDYGNRFAHHGKMMDGYMQIGSAASVASGRISYVFGLEGPAISVDTACSSSLVTLHLAAQALRAHECDLALAGGATVMATPTSFIEFSRQGALAPDGRCKPFSDQADGVAWSEGVGMLLLERLSDAKRLGHPVLALVRGSAINQDGRSQGLTAPNGPAQQRVIQAALAAARLTAREVDVVEGHGTGTRLGDPIEAQALLATYGREHSAEQPLWLGSIKSNIGHTQAAAGAAGIIKLVLALHHRMLPGSLYSEHPSAQVDWSEQTVRLLDHARAWEPSGHPRRGAISSFGISGTNAHVILEEPGVTPAAESEVVVAAPPHLPLLFSAKSDAAVREQARRLRATGQPLLDVAYSLVRNRMMLERRAVAAVSSLDELEPQQLSTVTGTSYKKLAMLFSGQGSQRLGMGRVLRDAYPRFRQTFDEICARFDPLLDRSLAEIIFAQDGSEIDQTEFTQPALFTIEVALYRLFEGWGVVPDVLLGHSIGELAAAHVAGVFALDDACKLVAARGRLMQALPSGGAMVAVQASEAELTAALERHQGVDIAGLNGPMSTVISGDEGSVLALAAELEGRGRKTTRLTVSHAFHSHRMEAMLRDFEQVAASVSYSAPQIPVVANVTGQLAKLELCSAGYWVRQVRSAVRFHSGVQTLESRGVGTMLELGPHGVLSAMATGCLSDDARSKVAMFPALRRDRPETETIALALGGLCTRGIAVDWEAYFEPFGPKRADLPTYAFQRSRFWLDAPEPHQQQSRRRGPVAGQLEHPLLGHRLSVSGPADVSYWEQEISLDEFPWLADHRVGMACIFPGAAYVEMALAAAQTSGKQLPITLERCIFSHTLTVPSKPAAIIQSMMAADRGGTHIRFSEALINRGWQQLATIQLSGSPRPPSGATLGDAKQRCSISADVERLYLRMATVSLNYGPSFRGVRELWKAPDARHMLGQIHAPRDLDTGSLTLHPAVLDACFHVGLAALLEAQPDLTGPILPVQIEYLHFERAVESEPLWCEATLCETDDGFSLSFALWDMSGASIGQLDGAKIRVMDTAAGQQTDRPETLAIEWRGVPAPVPSRQGRWLLVGQQPKLLALIQDELRVHGADSVEFIDPELLQPDAIATALERASKAGPVEGILYLGGLDQQPLEDLDGREVVKSTASGWRGLLYLVQALARLELDEWRLVLVTERSQAVSAGELARPDQALVWGLGNTVSAESSRLTVRVDLGGIDKAHGRALVNFVLSDSREREVAIRGDRYHVPRLIQRSIDGLSHAKLRSGADGMYCAELGEDGQVALVSGERRVPTSNEVELAVEYACVSRATDGDGEAALAVMGHITRVGATSGSLRTGMRVFALTTGPVATHSIVNSEVVFEVADPAHSASRLGAWFVHTYASYAVHELGRLRPGGRVRVHGGNTPLGRAVTEQAKEITSELHTVEEAAPTQAWPLTDLVVDCVGHLESGRVAIGGQLVTVGPLAFELELGRSYSQLDLAGLLRHSPAAIRTSATRILQRVVNGELDGPPAPPMPLSKLLTIPPQAVTVVQVQEVVAPTIRIPLSPSAAFEADATYLVTGGLGGLGLSMARWMAERGAGGLVLVGRSGVARDDQRQALAEIERLGAHVTVATADVADIDALAGVLAQICDERPLRGVVHTAGVLADATLINQTSATFEQVLAPKVSGAWNLHRLTKGLELDFFILYSSAGTLLRSGGQGNYSAANVFLDSLASYRRSLGLPALAIAWGVVSDVGLAADHDNRANRLASRGIRPLTSEACLDVLSRVLFSELAYIAPCPLDLPRWIAGAPELAGWPFLAELLAGLPELTGSGTSEIRESVRRGASTKELRASLLEHVTRLLGEILRTDPSLIDEGTMFAALGVDSLLTMELLSRLQQSLEIKKISATILFEHPTPRSLTEALAEMLMESEISVDVEDAWRSDLEFVYEDYRPLDREAKEILITGATGFLGAHVLMELLGRTSSGIHVLVRAGEAADVWSRLIGTFERWELPAQALVDAKDRIVVLEADLRSPRFGLTKEIATHLEGIIDVFISVGAHVDWMLPYERLRETNVYSVKQMLEFMGRGRSKRLAYVSSIGAATDIDSVGRFTETALGAKPGIRQGYSVSKFVGERLVLGAVRHGLDAVVLRPGFVAASSVSGLSSSGQMESRYLRACVNLGAVPNVAMNLDFTPVNMVAAMVVEAALRTEVSGHILHLAQPYAYSPSWLRGQISQLGWPCEVIAESEWRDRLDQEIALGDRELIPLKEYLEQLINVPQMDTSTARELLVTIRNLPDATLRLALEVSARQGWVRPRG